MTDELGEIADGDKERCGFTVHANGDWGDHRCELVIDHPGPHAIGLRHHAVPLLSAIVLLTVDCDEERIALSKRVERYDAVKKELADLIDPEDPNDLGGPHISIPWVLDRFASQEEA